MSFALRLVAAAPVLAHPDPTLGIAYFVLGALLAWATAGAVRRLGG